MRKWLELLLLAVLSWSGSALAQSMPQDADSLGNLWVVTVDLSGSMIDGGHFPGKTVQDKAKYMAKQLYPRLIRGKAFEPADFSRDSFLFFTSGYAYPYLKKGATSLDSCFIHHTDRKVYHFDSREELANHICNLLNRSKYPYEYKQSFVSQIAPFSAVKASRYISQQHWGNCYGAMYVVTLTDDAEGTQQWMNDFRNIKKWDSKKTEEISEITSQYIYNSLNGSGKGRMTELSADEDFYVHVRSYRYELMDAATQRVRNEEILNLSARDGSTVKLDIPAAYKEDSVQFIQIDSIRANDRMYHIGQRFVPNTGEVLLPVDYDVKRFRNDFTVYGHMQLAYGDTLWGEHLRKVYFEQNASQMPDRIIWRIVLYAAGGALLLAAILWLLLAVIPNIRLLTISIGCYDFYVLRCRRRYWKKEGTHLLSCVLKDGTVAPLFSSRLPMLREEPDSSGTNNTIVVRSRYQLDFIKDESLRDSSLSYASFEKDEKTTAKGEHVYTLKNVTPGVIAISLPLIGKPLLISVEEEKKRICKNFSQMMEMSVLQNYLQLRHKKYNVLPRYDAIVAYGRYDEYVYWSVLSPEYDVDDKIGLPLSQARCLFSFRHPSYGVDDELLQKLKDLMVRQVHKEHPEFKKIAAAKVDIAVKQKTFMGDFKIFYPVCGCYICAVEDVLSKPSMQTLYSPMGDEWDQTCVPVSVRRMRTEGKLIGAFLPYSVLRNAFGTVPDSLWYGIGTPNPHTPQLLNFREDCDFLRIVFHDAKHEGLRISAPAKTLSFYIINDKPFCY